MKKYLWLLILLAPLLLAASVQQQHKAAVGRMNVAAAGAAFVGDVLNETFDATGYDIGACGSAPCWTETATPEEDDTTNPPVGAATGFSGQAVKISTSWAAEKIHYDLDGGTTGDDVWYIRVRYYFATDVFTATPREILNIRRLDDSQIFRLDIEDQSDNGTFNFEVAGCSTADTGAVTFGTGESVEVEIKVSNTDDDYDWYVNGTLEGQDLGCSITTNPAYLEVGAIDGGSLAAHTFYIDDIDIDTSGFPTD